MSSGEPLYRAVFGDDGHLAMAKDGGFLGAVLNNDNNILQEQARFFEVDPDELNNGGGNAANVLIAAAGVAVGILATVAVVKAAPRIKVWWLETARPGLQGLWESLTKRKGLDPKATLLELAAPVEPAKISNEVAVVVNDDREVMSSAEAQQRYLAMMLAVAFAAEQLRLLEGARIEDTEKLRELKRAAAQLSTQEAADLANRMLEADDSLLDDDSQAMFVAVFGGGGKVDGKYLPIEPDRIEDAMRFPEDEED